MHWNRLLIVAAVSLVVMIACNKEEEPVINPCMNGQLDPGETAIDYGGTCGDCPDPEYPTAGFSFNGAYTSVSTKQLTYSNDWKLYVANDSVSVQVNLGNDGTVGTDTLMNASGSYAFLNGVSYPTLVEGSSSITSHNLSTQKLSGFFQATFVRVPGDTLHITNGYFNFLHY
ncbi:MAG: hypothetical protein QE487_14955 [Fluviicola sp.]|nr:hypothetical protein [Fluviicola sp.]